MIEVQKLYNEIGFRVSGNLLAQVYQWERSIDEMVFKEQLEMGSFRGRFRISPPVRALMEKAQDAGKIMLYYGAGGSSGEWSNWVDEDALTGRYTYEFGRVSMGATGFAIRVTDRRIGETIDITDYDAW